MKKYILLLLLTAVSFKGIANTNTKKFTVEHPDYSLSPYTGMTRQHWTAAAKYLLEGAFAHIRSLDDPMYFQRMGNVCYPRDTTGIRGTTMEGLARTLFMAAPLIHEDSTVTINNIRLADYYRHQLSLLVDNKNKFHISHRGNRGPCQDLVEFGALSVCFFVCGDVVWDRMPKATRDSLYTMIESYADGPTVPQNWRFFNVFAMSFFKTRGYPVNDALLNKYLHELLADYRGNGWYFDNPNYDYYSMWAYQLYGKLWAKLYGHKYLPQIASAFEHNMEDMYTSYPYLFSRNGEMPMWGRSNLYRFASIAPLPWGDSGNKGWMRRIASGCLLQFLKNPNFLSNDGILTPGFYGLFDPVLQGYSCRGSVYWCAKAFLSLLLPADDSYWTARENEGPWKSMKADEARNLYLQGPKMLITDYANSGAAELRAFCNYDTERPGAEKFRGSEQYNRLAYNSLLPWMADGKNGEVAMNYLVKNKNGKMEPLRRYKTVGYQQERLVRTVWLQSDPHFTMKLQDVILPDGTLRIDEITSADKSTLIRLGHYALPEKDKKIIEHKMKIDNDIAYIIDNGQYELAMIALSGWNNLQFVRARGLHPESKFCETINAFQNVSSGSKLITLLLFTKGHFSKAMLEKNIKLANEKIQGFNKQQQKVTNIIRKVNTHWQKNHSPEVRAFWDNSIYHTGNMEVFKLLHDSTMLDYSLRWANHNKWKGANEEDSRKWVYKYYGEDQQHVLFGDWQACFQTYLDLYFIEPEKYKIMRAYEVMDYETCSKANDYWWWADALYMVMPVMTKMYKLTGDYKYLDKLYNNILYSDSIMLDKETGLYFRDGKYIYPKHKTDNGAKDFWSRGNGWVFAGLAKVLQDMPVDCKYHKFFTDKFKNMAKSIARLQQKQGYWTRSMMDAWQAPGQETSGTALFTYGLLWGVNNGYLNKKEYAPIIKRAWKYLSTVALQPDGSIGYVQPIGEKAIPGQILNAGSECNFGTGAFLLAACEYIKFIR